MTSTTETAAEQGSTAAVTEAAPAPKARRTRRYRKRTKFQLVPVVAQMMKSPYPELGDTIERVQKGIKAEETTFFGTVGAGLNRITKMFDDMRSADRVTVQGQDAAELVEGRCGTQVRPASVSV